MSKSRWTPPKYNGTDLKHRQCLLMLICLCISADLLIAGLMQQKKLPFLILAGIFFVLAFIALNDPKQENSGNLRISGFVLMLLGALVWLTILSPWFLILGALQILDLVFFAAWPYRKRLFKRIHKP